MVQKLDPITTIQIRVSTRELIKSQKIYERERINDVLIRMFALLKENNLILSKSLQDIGGKGDTIRSVRNGKITNNK